MSLLKTSGAAVAVGIVGAAALAVPAVSAASRPAASRVGATSSSAIARLIAQKLEANNNYPETQIALSIPSLAVKGVTARDAAVVTGLRFVVATERTKAGKPAPAQLDVYYKAADLAQLRAIGGNIYILLNVSKWHLLPITWSAATAQSVSGIGLAFGGRWLELPASTVSNLTKRTATTKSLGSTVNSFDLAPAKLDAAAAAAVGQLLSGITLSDAPAAGGNTVFDASGSLQTLAGGASKMVASFEKAFHRKVTALSPGSAAGKGTFKLHMSTAASGAYLADVNLQFQAPGQGSGTFALSFSHAPEAIIAPAGATAITPSMLGGL